MGKPQAMYDLQAMSNPLVISNSLVMRKPAWPLMHARMAVSKSLKESVVRIVLEYTPQIAIM